MTNDQKCNECRSESLFESERIGTTYCQVCGLEKVKLMVDYGIEWKTLAEKNNNFTSSEQTCIYKNIGVTETGYLTTLSIADASVNRSRQVTDIDTKFKRFSRDIEILCDELNLSAHSIRSQACTISNEMAANGMQKSTRLMTIHAAAVLYAARIEGGDSRRTFREVATAAARPQKEIARCVKFIENVLMKTRSSLSDEGTEHPIISYARNFALYLNLPRNWVLFTKHLATKVIPSRAVNDSGLTFIEKPWEGRSRSSIAATVVYIVSRLPKFPLKLDLKNISFRTGVRISTIMTCYRDMIPVIDKLLESAPPEFVSLDEITNTFQNELLSIGCSIKRT